MKIYIYKEIKEVESLDSEISFRCGPPKNPTPEEQKLIKMKKLYMLEYPSGQRG